MGKTIHIFYATDENYAKFLTVSLESLMENASTDNRYEIHVLHNGLSYTSRTMIRKLEQDGFRISFVNAEGKLQAAKLRTNLRDYYTLTTYYRLLLPDLYPYISKAIYLDCDTIIEADISKLYETDLSNNLVGAAHDASLDVIKEFADYVNGFLSMKPSDYFNAGVLVMNLSKMRKTGFLSKATKLMAERAFPVAQDQDVLNVLCNGKTKLIDGSWNVMPIGESADKANLIHFNLIYKPWKRDGIPYGDRFWEYAKRAEVLMEVKAYKDSLTEEILQKEEEGMDNLRKLCAKQAKEKSEYRKTVLSRISTLEKEGRFDVDAEDDPPFTPILPGQVDYQRKKLSTRIKSFFAVKASFRYFKRKIRNGEIVIDGYEGLSYLSGLKTGAVITANHFNPFDSIPINLAVKKCTKKKLFTVIKEGNWSFPGIYGHFMRNCNTLPLASNADVMIEMLKGVRKVLRQGNLLLVYAEQSMWWNYRKPKPLKIGAFSFAAKNKVPVIPTFITMRDTDRLDSEGLPIQAYTLHILKPIMPNPSNPYKEDANRMLKENEKAWKELYERIYGIPLAYEVSK